MKSNCGFDNHGEVVGLLMTYRCNLDCKYCYIHHKQNKDMSYEMACSIIKPFLLDESSGWLDILFVGAETLMAFDTIRRVVEWAERFNTKRHFRFCGSTNGTLLSKELKPWISEHSKILTLGLSYDGLPTTQNSNRGSDNIDVDFFIKNWPKQPIQMTINAQSVQYMADGVIYLLEKGAVVHPNVAFEDEEWPDDAIEEYGKQLDRLVEYYITHERVPLISQFIHSLKEYVDLMGNPKSQPQMCGAGNGYQVFDVDGKSYPCHMISPLVLSGDKLDFISDGCFRKIESFSDPQCKGCPYVLSCPTCMASNYLYRNSFQCRDNTHCKIMQLEVQAYIKKEVMRLTAKKTLTPEDATEIDLIAKITEFWKNNSRR